MKKLSSHTKAFQKNKLKSGEEIIDHLEGYIGELMGTGENTQHNGSLILTTDRVVFYRKGFFGERIRQIKLEKITSIDTDTLLGHKTLEFHTSHDSIKFKTFDKFDEVLEKVEELRA